ncbi:MAG: MBL fold metallo-hydrolase [Syntrophomonadaceae bacterium]|nr:MBL fold metallo-hydrolase [Syntrophomonadaceae bacterium]MDD3889879.1 MBL fold metallo-hydrolase [Syntrophomonadaceae bacterium]MDD4548551.1 MBL fold metallo-hydrolase [Syntrophomonadaceae bacterium]
MQVHVLASGSTGNAVFFQFGHTKILVDAGISTRRIEKGLAEVGVKAGDLDGVLITHEHTDHIKGLDVLIRRYEIPVYARSKTWGMIKCRDKFSPCCRVEMPESFDIGGVKVEPFSTPHDAVDPVGFCFYYQQGKYVLATDLGIVTPSVAEALTLADVAVMESNHDLEMLIMGPYPGFLKQRIRGNNGHLSNHDAGKVLASIPRKKGMQVFLAHLSQQNNLPMLAEKTVADILLQSNCAVGEEVILHRTYPNRRASFSG